MNSTVNLSEPQIQLIRDLAKLHGVMSVKLFGSRATGRATKASDIDLLVQFGDKATLLSVIGFQQAVESALGAKVDVVEEGGISPFIAARILKQALPI